MASLTRCEIIDNYYCLNTMGTAVYQEFHLLHAIFAFYFHNTKRLSDVLSFSQLDTTSTVGWELLGNRLNAFWKKNQDTCIWVLIEESKACSGLWKGISSFTSGQKRMKLAHWKQFNISVLTRIRYNRFFLALFSFYQTGKAPKLPYNALQLALSTPEPEKTL